MKESHTKKRKRVGQGYWSHTKRTETKQHNCTSHHTSLQQMQNNNNNNNERLSVWVIHHWKVLFVFFFSYILCCCMTLCGCVNQLVSHFVNIYGHNSTKWIFVTECTHNRFRNKCEKEIERQPKQTGFITFESGILNMHIHFFLFDLQAVVYIFHFNVLSYYLSLSIISIIMNLIQSYALIYRLPSVV